MAGIVSGILLGVCLAGLAIALYMQLVGYDPVTQSRGMRTAIVISADFLGILCLLAGQLIAAHFHWGGARAQTRLDVWVAIGSALLGAGAIHAWQEWHRKPPPPKAPWEKPS